MSSPPKSFTLRDDKRGPVILFEEPRRDAPIGETILRINKDAVGGPTQATVLGRALVEVLEQARQRVADRLGRDHEPDQVPVGRHLAGSISDMLQAAKPGAAPAEVWVIGGSGGDCWAVTASYDAALDWFCGHGGHAKDIASYMADGLSKEDAVAATIVSAGLENCWIACHTTTPRPGCDSHLRRVDLVEKGEAVIERLNAAYLGEDDEDDEALDVQPAWIR